MKRIARIALTATAISLASLVAGCESFDPTNLFDAEIFCDIVGAGGRIGSCVKRSIPAPERAL